MARPPNPEAPQRLLEAARACFAEVGVDAARVQDIAERAGFSKAAFYLYFDSKEAVFARLIARFFEEITAITNERHRDFTRLLQRLGPCTAMDYANNTERLRAFAALDQQFSRRALRALWENRDMAACVLEQTTGPRRALVDQFVEVLRSTLSGRLREAVVLGIFRPDVDGDLVSDMIMGIWLQLGRRMVRLKHPPDIEQWATALDRFVSEGMSGLSPQEEP